MYSIIQLSNSQHQISFIFHISHFIHTKCSTHVLQFHYNSSLLIKSESLNQRGQGSTHLGSVESCTIASAKSTSQEAHFVQWGCLIHLSWNAWLKNYYSISPLVLFTLVIPSVLFTPVSWSQFLANNNMTNTYGKSIIIILIISW